MERTREWGQGPVLRRNERHVRGQDMFKTRMLGDGFAWSFGFEWSGYHVVVLYICWSFYIAVSERYQLLRWSIEEL